jgi:CDP-diglyceride synthetase
MSAERVGWIIWGILTFFAISWGLNCYILSKSEKGITYATLNTTIIWWLLLGWTFYYSGMNKLHLLWLAPAAVPVSIFVTISRAFAGIGQMKILPPGLLSLLVGYIAVLWLLTP